MSARGVTLIELVIVIVALSIGVLLLGTAYLQAARSIPTNENIQIATQVAQACADHILGRRRMPGTFTFLGSTPPLCPTINGLTPVVSVTAMGTGPIPTDPCQTGWTCNLVDVQVTRDGFTAQVQFMAVQY
jgi:prepilin-type N-terminal cleavage/methylation domain-containing protein